MSNDLIVDNRAAMIRKYDASRVVRVSFAIGRLQTLCQMMRCEKRFFIGDNARGRQYVGRSKSIVLYDGLPSMHQLASVYPSTQPPTLHWQHQRRANTQNVAINDPPYLSIPLHLEFPLPGVDAYAETLSSRQN